MCMSSSSPETSSGAQRRSGASGNMVEWICSKRGSAIGSAVVIMCNPAFNTSECFAGGVAAKA